MEGDNDDGNKGRSSPFAGMFGAIGKAISPIGNRKEGQDKPPKLTSAPSFGSDVNKPSAVVPTDAKGALEKAQSAEETTKKEGGQDKEKSGWFWGGRRRKRKSKRTKRMARRKSRRSKRRKTRRKSRRKRRRRRGRGWGNPNWRVGSSGTKQAGETCTRKSIGSECDKGLICQNDKCIDKKDSKFFYRSGKAMDTFDKHRPRGPSMRALNLSAPSFLTGGKRKKTRRKKKRKSRRRKSRRRRR